MSKTRVIVRVLLLVAIIGVGWLGYQTYARTQPDFYWNKAERAIEAEQWETAQIQLKNLLGRFPEHGPALRKMADVEVALANASRAEAAEGDEAPRRDLTVAEVPSALAFLAAAAKQQPDDLELQKTTLNAFVRRGQYDSASAPAKVVLESDPKNATALFVLARTAVAAGNDKSAVEYLERLRNTQSSRVFQAFAMEAELHQQNEEPEKVTAIVREARKIAKALTAEQLGLLTRRDRETMANLMLMGVVTAPNSASAVVAAEDGLAVMEKLQKATLLNESELGLASARLALALDIGRRNENPSQRISEVDMARLHTRAAAIAAPAREAEVKEPALYYQAALAEFAQGGVDNMKAGAAVLEKGLALCADLVEDRENEVLGMHLLAARWSIRAGEFSSAQRHIDVLLQNEHSVGWAHMMAGAVASSEGRHEAALQSYTKAQRELGNTMLVRMGLANVHLALGNWKETIPHLNELSKGLQDLDEEQRDWAAREIGGEENVQLGLLAAYLNLDRWNDAQKPLDALRGTRLGDRGWAMAVTYLAQNGHRAEANKLIAGLRKQYDSSILILQLDLQRLAEAKKTEQIGPLLAGFVKDNPDSLAAYLLLARYQVGQKAFAEAQKTLERIPDAVFADVTQRQAVAAMKAQLHLQMGNPEKALAIADTLENAQQQSLVRAAVNVSEQNLDAAAENLQDATSGPRKNGYLKVLAGQVLAQKGDLSGAIEQFSQSMDVTAVRQAARQRLATTLAVLARREGPEAALEKTDELLAASPDDTALLILKGDFLTLQGKFDEAHQVFEKLESLDPESEAAAYLKANAWLRQGNYANAVEEAKRALENREDLLGAMLIAASASLADRKFTQAREFAESGLETYPDNWALMQVKYSSLKSLEQDAAATTVLTDAMAAYPKLPQPYVLRAQELIQEERVSDAIAIHRQAQKELPENLVFRSAEVGLLARNDVKAAQGRAEEHLKDEALPNKFQVTLAFAESFKSAQEWSNAQSWAEQARGLAANDGEKSQVEWSLGDGALKQATEDKQEATYAKAAEHFRNVLKLTPNNFIAANNLMWILAMRLDKAEEAQTVYENTFADIPVTSLPPTIIDTIADVHRRSGREADAMRLVTAALKTYPRSAALHFQLGMLAAAQNRQAASQALSSALKLGLSPEQEAEAKKMLAKLN